MNFPLDCAWGARDVSRVRKDGCVKASVRKRKRGGHRLADTVNGRPGFAQLMCSTDIRE